MNIEDCKIGTRVVCLNASSGVIPKGAFGIVIEDGAECPSVSWEKIFSKHQYNHMGYSNVYALMLNKIEKVSENFVPEKEIAKLTVSVSVEDKEEIAKDILKIVLQDLYVIIADAIDSLELNNTESSSVQTDTNIVTEDSVLTNLLNLIEKATADGDLESLLNLTTAYQRMKNASTI